MSVGCGDGGGAIGPKVTRVPSRDELAAALLDPDYADVAAAALSMGVTVIPVFGGAFSSAINERRRQHADRRYFLVLADLALAMEGLQDRLDVLLAGSSGFAAFVDATLEEAARARQFVKRSEYVNGLANSVLEGHPEFVESEMYMAMLDDLQPVHLRLLRAVEEIPSEGRSFDYLKEGTVQYDAVRGSMGDVPQPVINRAWEDLASHGLLESRFVVRTEGPPDDGSNEPPMTAHGFGFIGFLKEPGAGSKTVTATPEPERPGSGA